MGGGERLSGEETPPGASGWEGQDSELLPDLHKVSLLQANPKVEKILGANELGGVCGW